MALFDDDFLASSDQAHARTRLADLASSRFIGVVIAIGSTGRARCLRVSSVVHTAQPVCRTFAVDVCGTLKPIPSTSCIFSIRNRFIYLIHHIRTVLHTFRTVIVVLLRCVVLIILLLIGRLLPHLQV